VLLISLPVLIGLARYPLLDLESAAIAFTAAWLWLAWRAWRAPYTDYRRQELWLVLDRWHGLPEHKAHAVISGALRRAFLSYADLSALVAVLLWTAYFGCRLMG